MTFSIRTETLSEFLEDIRDNTESIIECVDPLKVEIVFNLSDISDEHLLSAPLRDLQNAIEQCEADQKRVILGFNNDDLSPEKGINVGKAFAAFISGMFPSTVDLSLYGTNDDCIESFLVAVNMQAICSLNCGVTSRKCHVLRNVLVDRPQPPILQDLRLDFGDWDGIQINENDTLAHNVGLFPLTTICDILEKTNTPTLIVQMRNLRLKAEYVDALIIALSNNSRLESVNLVGFKWNTRYPDANGPTYLSRCIVKLLESRKNWESCAIDINHIHVDDEFWKRCATCLRKSIGHLMFRLGRIPLDLDTASQYNQFILQDREIREKYATSFRFLRNPSDPLPLQLIDAFKAKLHAEETYLGVVESIRKRPRILPLQLTAQTTAELMYFNNGDEEEDIEM